MQSAFPCPCETLRASLALRCAGCVADAVPSLAALRNAPCLTRLNITANSDAWSGECG